MNSMKICFPVPETTVNDKPVKQEQIKNGQKIVSKTKAIIYAFLAAAFYAVNVPVSKLLLEHVGPRTMAALLYLGAGIGMSVLSLFGEPPIS